MNNAILKELTAHKNILKAINKAYRIDFQKEYNLYKIDGSFTINSLYKTIGTTDSTNNNIILLLDNTKDRYRNYIYYASLANGKIDIENKKTHSICDRLDYFYAKKVFEEIRKAGTATTYIIVQSKAHQAQPTKEKAIDTNERYIYLKHDFIGKYNSSDKAIQRIYAKDLITGAKHTYNIDYANNWNNLNVYDFIDKSGYFTEHKRNELKRKAKALKAQRKATEANNTDYTRLLKELENNITATKKAIIALYEIATTYNSIDIINDCTRELKWIYREYNHLLEDIANKKLTSTEAVYENIDYIMNKIKKINEIIGG